LSPASPETPVTAFLAKSFDIAIVALIFSVLS
jgi:hypothetical protein